MSENGDELFENANGGVGGAPVTNIYKVSIKYSPFNREDPEIWFLQLESQFDLRGITVDGTKYSHLLAALDPETVKCVREKIINPERNNKYNSLKAAILERICDSAKIKLDRLLSGLQLGDKRPSQLLREMQALANNQLNDAVLRNLWFQRLPTHSQEILSTMEDASLDKIAITADKILEVNKPAGIFGVSYSDPSNSNHRPNDPLGDLTKSVRALSKRVDELFVSQKSCRDKSQTHNSRSNSRNFRDTRNRSASRSKEQVEKHPNCWYHHKFGQNAQKCLKPCNFSSSSKLPTQSEN